MKNIELLQATGIRDIRIVSYQLKDDARMREAFPDTALYVVSNGLLIPRVKKEILDAIRESNAVVYISYDPPTVKMTDRIKAA